MNSRQESSIVGVKTEFAEMLQMIGTGMPNGIRLTITGVTAEGDRVAVEMNAAGTSAIGLEYRNQYHDLLEIRDCDPDMRFEHGGQPVLAGA